MTTVMCLDEACRYFEKKTGYESRKILELSSNLSQDMRIELLMEIANNVARDELKANPGVVSEFVEFYTALKRPEEEL